MTVDLQINQYSTVHFKFTSVNWFQEAMEPLRHNNIYLVTHKILALYKQEKGEINLISQLFLKMEEGQQLSHSRRSVLSLSMIFPYPHSQVKNLQI